MHDSSLRAYVSGGLTGQGVELRQLYEDAAEVLARAGFIAYVPHLATDPVRHPDVTAAQVYETDRHHVATADLVVVFLGRPSFGVGQELEIAADALVPLLLIAPERDVISRMAMGGRAKHYGPLRYREWADLKPQLSRILPVIATELRSRPRPHVPVIGDAIKRARVRAGYSRAELARRVGVTEEFVRLVETADPLTSNPTLAFVGVAASTLGVTIPELLGTGPQVEAVLLASLREFALRERLSFREFSDLQEMAARGLAPDRALSVDDWRQIREARARSAAGIQQLELPTDGKS